MRGNTPILAFFLVILVLIAVAMVAWEVL